MNKSDLNNNFDEIIDTNINVIVKKFMDGESFLKIINKPLKKAWTQAIFILIRADILLISFEKLKENPEFLKRLKEEFFDVEEVYKGLKNCELCFYNLFNEMEKLNELIIKQ